MITHPNVSFYDFYKAYDHPIKADKQSYLEDRSGILAQSAPNLATVFWQEIEGDDGITRQLQWTARVEGSHDISSKKAMTISQYLGRGATSRGRTTINAALNMVVSKPPYLHNRHDVAAVAAGIEALRQSLSSDPAIEIVYPPKNQTTAKFLDSYPLTRSYRSANHWMGSCKMGLDSGLRNEGTSVVDTNAKVYGTDNLFIVDASIFPGMVSTNPSALIVAAAEHASQLILGLANNSTAPFPVSSSRALSTSAHTIASSSFGAAAPSSMAGYSSAVPGKSTVVGPTGTGSPTSGSPSATASSPFTNGEVQPVSHCRGIARFTRKSCMRGLTNLIVLSMRRIWLYRRHRMRQRSDLQSAEPVLVSFPKVAS